MPSEHATIQKAIDAAQDGDVVLVRPGTYYESINFRGKAITVRASDLSSWPAVQKTVISAEKSKSNCVTFDHGETPASVLEGFTLRFAQKGGLVPSKKGPFEAAAAFSASIALRRSGVAASPGTMPLMAGASPCLAHARHGS